ncbi:MAG TPA: PAS domain-containing sensor histidine kinase [Candidatus Thermoplasmatota archaeon]|nr:PAS domain-containing sensor histidine kinase [Candidatus Thermoplasmatota archaeon]
MTAPAPRQVTATAAARATVLACALLTASLAALVLAGWRLGWPVLTSLAPGGPSMMATTAWALMALAAGLLAIRRGRLPAVSLMAGILVATFGMAVAAEYALGLDLGVDGWGWRIMGSTPPPSPRIAPLTALGLIAAGTATAAMGSAKGRRLGTPLALVGGAVGLLQLTTDLYGTRVPGRNTQMAAHTALAILLLAIGQLSLRPHEGRLAVLWGRSEASRVARRLLPAALLSPLALGLPFALAVRSGTQQSLFALALFAASTAALVTSVVWVVILHLERTGAARDALVEADQRKTALLTAITETTSDSISVKDLDSRYVYLNAAAGRLLGHPAQDLVGTDLSQVLDAATLARVRDQERGVIATGQPETREQVIPVDGVKHLLLTEKAPYRDLQGRIVGTIGVSRDITDRKKAEEDLRRAEERLSKVFEATPVGIALTHADGRFVDVNPAFQQITGRTRHQLLSPSFTAYQLWEDPADRDRMLAQVRGGALVRGHGVRAKRADGQLRDLEVSMDLLDVGGETLILTIAADVTDQALAARQRDAHSMALAELDRLQRIEQFRTAFINTTAHELATPLTPILIDMRLLAGPEVECLPAQQRRALGSLLRNIERLRQTAQGVIDASRVQSAQLRLDLQDLDVATAVRDAVATHATPAQRAGVRLEMQPGGSLCVRADPGRLALILGHLLGNALKFTPAGGRVVVAWGRRDGFARIRVQDTGPGLDEAQQALLWQPYSQVHDRMQSSAVGSGLGLFVSRNLVALHGGDVGVESPMPGGGSTFWFTLPLGNGDATAGTGGQRGLPNT